MKHYIWLSAEVIWAGMYCGEDDTLPHGVGVRFTDVSREGMDLISALTADIVKRQNLWRNTGSPPLASKKGGKTREERPGVNLQIEPTLYPRVKVCVRREAKGEHTVLAEDVAMSEGFWLTLADACEHAGDSMTTSQSQLAKRGLHLFSHMVTTEIKAEGRRLRNRELYESLTDFVAEIYKRTDLDIVRKAQLIHNEACRLPVKP